MTDRPPLRSHRGVHRFVLLALVGVLAAAGWLAGQATGGGPPDAGEPVRRGAALSPPPRPALPPPALAGAPDAIADVHHPRPAHEWQGMRVDLSQRQYCEASSYCGFALACLDDRQCGPCQRDDQCAASEVCVLDHCVAATHAGCRTRADCAAGGPGAGADALCVLSGLSGGDPRGNTGMRSYCQPSSGGTPQDESVPDARRAARLAEAAAQQPVAPPVSAATLRARLSTEPPAGLEAGFEAGFEAR